MIAQAAALWWYFLILAPVTSPVIGGMYPTRYTCDVARQTYESLHGLSLHARLMPFHSYTATEECMPALDLWAEARE